MTIPFDKCYNLMIGYSNTCYIIVLRVSPKAFKLEKLKSGAEDYISVLRYNAEQLDSVSAVFQPRTKGDSRYGYTFLNVLEKIYIRRNIIGSLQSSIN